jgi:hypothetical protein
MPQAALERLGRKFPIIPGPAKLWILSKPANF